MNSLQYKLESRRIERFFPTPTGNGNRHHNTEIKKGGHVIWQHEQHKPHLDKQLKTTWTNSTDG